MAFIRNLLDEEYRKRRAWLHVDDVSAPGEMRAVHEAMNDGTTEPNRFAHAPTGWHQDAACPARKRHRFPRGAAVCHESATVCHESANVWRERATVWCERASVWHETAT